MPELLDRIVLVCPSCGMVRSAVRRAVVTATAACVRCNKPFPVLSGGPSRAEETALSPATLTRLLAAANDRR